jgi:hypothetical protein
LHSRTTEYLQGYQIQTAGKVRKDDPDETKAIEEHRISLRKLIWVDSEWGRYTEDDLARLCEQHTKIQPRKRQ